MNPFDRARLQAHQARHQLVAVCGSGLPTSTELLNQFEDVLDLCIEQVPPDNAILGNGSAALYRDEQFIYVRNDVDAKEHAYLVAHELGHWFLDAEKPSTSITQLTSLTASQGTPASLVVEAYGTRERQELQANVFAREFLLPRWLAKQLWIDGNTARQIAQQLVIPLELVRLQLADALFLPETAPLPAPLTFPPSADQDKAAKAQERFVNVVAGPGTGKTTTLVHRIRHLIDSGVKPSKILVLTFTNKAAHELVERLRASGVQGSADIWAGTFHAFGLEFLRKYHHVFGLDSDVRVADLLQEVQLMIRRLPSVNLQYYLRLQDPYDWLPSVLSHIKRLKEELVTPDAYRTRLSALPAPADDIALQQADIAALYEAHEQALEEVKMVDYVDLVAKPALRAKSDRASVSQVIDHYEHILVDEYQDVTEAMVELIRQLAGKAKSLWVVGDIRQAIHHWRGASVKSLIKFDQAFRGEHAGSTVGKYTLDINRRSKQEILDLFSVSGRIHQLQPSLPLDSMSASRGSSALLPLLTSCSSPQTLNLSVGYKIQQLNDLGVAYRDQAVICRRKSELARLADDLAKNGIPVLYIGDIYQRPEIKTLICLMQILCHRHPRALIGLTGDPYLTMPKQDLELLNQMTHQGVELQRGRWIGRTIPGLSPTGDTVNANLKVLLGKHSRHSNPWDLVCDLLFDRSYGIPPLSDNSIKAQAARLALWQFVYAVRNGDGDVTQARLSKYLLREELRRRIGETGRERDLPPEASVMNAVRLLTVHASKGLEFPAVHLGYVDKESFGPNPPFNHDPRVQELIPPQVLGSTAAEHAFEEAVERNNLLYVALSRARDQLYLYEHKESRDRPPSLLDASAKFSIQTGIPQPVTTSPAKAAFSPPGAIKPAITHQGFESYVHCPLQYHYRHELSLTAEQEIDISIRARGAVMDTLKSVFKDGVKPGDAFKDAWAAHRLPDKNDDPALQRDAVIACKRGLLMGKRSSGTYVERLVSELQGIRIELPWMLQEGIGAQARLHWIRAGSGAAYTANSARPMLLNINGARWPNLTVYSLLTDKASEVEPSKMASATGSYKAAERFANGDRSATPGTHCERCAYLSMCAKVP
ncbi:UvrD-helicase domain-containing protein [Pseudomonas fluorescens]|uniref:DNA 3'-5' helicase n=1 Tax=Pseudomonas fluorescens TaxID=294 RepID=A0A5E7C8R6_PSEFL|nr:UvrD-helicase domain-containing protein [Pseudomonas fluorescens]VVO01149.1 ATP-dependent DNA helicase Rep [Pseudomonas fluorescens]